MKKFAVSAAIAALAIAAAGSANAATEVFLPGTGTPTLGFTVIDTFNDSTGITGVLNTDYLLATSNTSQGAPPATPGSSSPFLSVLGGHSASITFSALTSNPVTSFEFDWGSIDTFNTLVIHETGGTDITIIPGTASFPNTPTSGSGDQGIANTNGTFVVTGAPGESFTGFTMSTGQNSFEIDNLAIPVPEPASWAMMIVGFGAIGFAMRRRNQMVAAV